MSVERLWDAIESGVTGSARGLGDLALHAVEAIIVLIIAAFVARRLRERTRRSLAKTQVGANMAALAGNGAAIGVYIIAVGIVLGIFGASWTAVLAALSLGTVALSLALQDLLKNFVAGVYLLLEQPFSIGEQIRVKDVSGTVEGIGFRTTSLRNADQELVLVPNAVVFVEIITNRSAYRFARTRVTVKGVTMPFAGAEAAIRAELHDFDRLPSSPLRITLRSTSSAGSDIMVAVAHEVDRDAAAEIMTRLARRFPEATVIAGEA